jgi:hypothetical protein
MEKKEKRKSKIFHARGKEICQMSKFEIEDHRLEPHRMKNKKGEAQKEKK